MPAVGGWRPRRPGSAAARQQGVAASLAGAATSPATKASAARAARPGRARCTNTRRAGGVELDQLADVRRHAARQHQPAQAPAGHQEALRKAVDDDQAVVGRGDVEKARRAALRRRLEVDALVDLVGDDPGAGRAAVREERLLLGARQRPAGRVVRRIDEQRRGCVGVTASSSASQVERHAPSAPGAARSARRGAPRIAGCAVRLGQTGTTATTSSPAPTSACIASISAFTPDDVTAMRSRADGRCKRADVAGQGLAQLGQAEVVRVEGLAALQRLDRGLADELAA